MKEEEDDKPQKANTQNSFLYYILLYPVERKGTPAYMRARGGKRRLERER